MGLPDSGSGSDFGSDFGSGSDSGSDFGSGSGSDFGFGSGSVVRLGSPVRRCCIRNFGCRQILLNRQAMVWATRKESPVLLVVFLAASEPIAAPAREERITREQFFANYVDEYIPLCCEGNNRDRARGEVSL